MFFILFAVLVSAVFVSAADHVVTVGDGGVSFLCALRV